MCRGTDAPIFIGGYMHSGTSVLMRILSKAPSVYCRRWESRFFGCLPRLRREFRPLSDPEVFRGYVAYVINLIWNGPDLGGVRHLKGEVHEVTDETVNEVAEMIAYDADHVVLYRRVFDALALREGACRWLEKTPGNIYHVETILEAIPDAKIVNIVRDPRDILASKKIRRQRVAENRKLPPLLRRERQLAVGYDPILDALAWKSAALAGRTATESHPEHVLTIRYEEFVADPVSMVKRICGFLNLPFHREMLEVSAHGSAEGGTGGARGPGIQRNRIERWKETLTQGEIRACQLVTSSEMTQAGYAQETVGLMSMAAMPILVGRSAFDILVRMYRKYRLGGAGYVRQVTSSWRRRAGLLFKG